MKHASSGKRKNPPPPPAASQCARIRFAAQPTGQTERAEKLLTGLVNLRIERIAPTVLQLHYSLHDYTLKGLESALRLQGFALADSLGAKLCRALVHFCEDTQLHNMRCPQRLIKQSHEVYVKAWGAHLHGDHDDTPLELREYK